MTIDRFLFENELNPTNLELKQGTRHIPNFPFLNHPISKGDLGTVTSGFRWRCYCWNNVYASKEPDNTSGQHYETGLDNQ